MDMLALQQRVQIMVQPDLMNNILLEGVRLRNESEARIEQLEKEMKAPYERRIELAKLSDSEKTCSRLKCALDVFNKSSSLRKKQLI